MENESALDLAWEELAMRLGTPESLMSWVRLTEALSARTVWDMEASLSIDDELMYQIQEEAERQGCSVSELIVRYARLLLGQAQAGGSVSPPVAERSLVIHAAFENGVLRPTEPVELPESSVVEVEVRQVTPPPSDRTQAALDKVYAILSRRYDTGEADIAARHNELEP